MIRISHSGNFKNTEGLFKRVKEQRYLRALKKYAQRGVEALSKATPVDTGKTASSWSYEIAVTREGYTIYWENGNVNRGISIALLLQYGHGTRNGGFVEGRDYINPALRPIFDQMADEAWQEVKG